MHDQCEVVNSVRLCGSLENTLKLVFLIFQAALYDALATH